MDERALLDRALSGETRSVRALVEHLAPVVHGRAVRALMRRRAGSGRSVAQEAEDLTQEAMTALFERDARALRAWDSTRGLSLAAFCGIVAEREIASMLRSGRRNPWTESPEELDTLERALGGASDVELRVASREALVELLDWLRVELSPRGLELFYRLVVDEEPASEVGAAMGMSVDAVYAWKSRLGKLARKKLVEIVASASERALMARSSEKEEQP